MYNKKRISLIFILILSGAFIFNSCSGTESSIDYLSGRNINLPESELRTYRDTQKKLYKVLESDDLIEETRYAAVARIANNMFSIKDYNSVILFLTEWVENHPEDKFNAYWLMMTAYAYLENDAEPMATYYFERIINNYDDLMVQGKSIHFLCYQHLIQISTDSANRITYFNQLINRFPNDVSITELYYRLALEYENEGDWDQAIKVLTKFLQRDDCQTIQIAGYPNAYTNTKQLIDFNNSSKDWTFETLDSLVAAVKSAIYTYNWENLDKYRSKVNFFAMSWRQDAADTTLPDNFSMRNFMTGNRIHYNVELDDSSSPTEAYLRTTGWSSYINVWYLYFRKVNFPADPDIHGRWEWAGIYYGEKM